MYIWLKTLKQIKNLYVLMVPWYIKVQMMSLKHLTLSAFLMEEPSSKLILNHINICVLVLKTTDELAALIPSLPSGAVKGSYQMLQTTLNEYDFIDGYNKRVDIQLKIRDKLAQSYIIGVYTNSIMIIYQLLQKQM